jgi:hypothetical protein
MAKTYTKTFDFGKIAYDGKNKSNLVQLDVTLKIDGQKTIFSVSGDVWQANMKDIIMGGQCLDEIWKDFSGELEDPTLFKQIMRLWEKFHLNDMHAECEHQERRGETWVSNPGAVCPDCGYKLGSAWTYRAIPKPYLCDIIRLLDVPPQEQLQIIRLAKKNK